MYCIAGKRLQFRISCVACVASKALKVLVHPSCWAQRKGVANFVYKTAIAGKYACNGRSPRLKTHSSGAECYLDRRIILVRKFEGLLDLFKLELMGYQGIDVDLPGNDRP